MKDDEKFMFTMCFVNRMFNISVRDTLSCPVFDNIAPKRKKYLLEKWANKGFYDYGVSLDLGWFSLLLFLPKEYKELVEFAFIVHEPVKRSCDFCEDRNKWEPMEGKNDGNE